MVWCGTSGYSEGTHGVLEEYRVGETGVPRRRGVDVSHSVAQSTAPLGLCGVLTGYSIVLTRYSQRRSCRAECRVHRSAPVRALRAHWLFGIGQRYALRFCACAAPTPVPTNVGDTNPPTRATTLSPTFPGGKRRVHSDAAEPSDCRRPCAMVPTVPCSREPPRCSGALPRNRGSRHGLRGAAAARTGWEYSRALDGYSGVLVLRLNRGTLAVLYLHCPGGYHHDTLGSRLDGAPAHSRAHSHGLHGAAACWRVFRLVLDG